MRWLRFPLSYRSISIGGYSRESIENCSDRRRGSRDVDFLRCSAGTDRISGRSRIDCHEQDVTVVGGCLFDLVYLDHLSV